MYPADELDDLFDPNAPADHPEEECGVFGVWAPGKDVARMTYFALHALQGLSLAEISRRYRRSESWARVLYYRAKRRIIAAMKEDGLDGL